MSTTFLTIQEAAEKLKVSERTIRRWIKQGNLPAFKIGKTVRILEKDINPIPTTTHSHQRKSDLDVASTSDESFEKTWNNDEDSVYDNWREIYGAQNVQKR